MKVALTFLVSMTVLSVEVYTQGGYLEIGPYALSGACVVRLSRVFARGLARVFRWRPAAHRFDPEDAAATTPTFHAALGCGRARPLRWSTDSKGLRQACYGRGLPGSTGVCGVTTCRRRGRTSCGRPSATAHVPARAWMRVSQRRKRC